MKKILLITLLIIVTVISGCIIQEPEQQQNTGTDGIEANFAEREKKVYDDASLEIVAEFRNKGGYDRPYGKAVIYGYDKSIITFGSDKGGYAEKQLPELNAKNSFTPEGGYESLTFVQQNMDVAEGDKYETTLYLGTCYHYKTVLTTDLCVAKDRSDCKDISEPPSGQGAPVTVTDIAQEKISDRIKVIATIENTGDGKVIHPGETAYNACPFNLHRKQFDRVKVNMDVNGMTLDTCSQGGSLRLDDDESRVECTFTGLTDSQAYTTQLKVEIDYNYLAKDEMDLTIFGS